MLSICNERCRILRSSPEETLPFFLLCSVGEQQFPPFYAISSRDEPPPLASNFSRFLDNSSDEKESHWHFSLLLTLPLGCCLFAFSTLLMRRIAVVVGANNFTLADKPNGERLNPAPFCKFRNSSIINRVSWSETRGPSSVCRRDPFTDQIHSESGWWILIWLLLPAINERRLCELRKGAL